MVLPENIRGIEFRKPIPEAATLLPELRANADMVIAATHMGHYADGRSGVNAPGDVELARSTRGLDLIVGGHSQNPVCMAMENLRNAAYVPGQPCAPDRQNGTWIVQAHEWGKYVGRADFTIDAGKVELRRYQLLPVNLKRRLPDGSKLHYTEPIAEDSAVRAFLQPFQARGEAQLGVPVGLADGVLDGDRERVRRQPTNLGVLVARSMMERTGADLAVVNSGGVRDSLPAGQISYRDVLKVHPFGNTLVTVQMTGAELLAYLQAAAAMTPGSGAFPQTAGVRMQIVGGRLEQASIGGAPLDAQRIYRLALTNFTATGGDGYPRLTGHPGYVDSGFVDAEVLRAYILQRSPLKIADYDPLDAVVRR
jgi:5'-nucleotidase/UDP-sugar diphosphatase